MLAARLVRATARGIYTTVRCASIAGHRTSRYAAAGLLMYLQDRADAEASAASLPLWWSLGLGTCGITLIALTVSAQIYLSMLHHGHSFLRIAAWQLCSWSVWAAATPAVLRLGAQLTPVARLRSRVSPRASSSWAWSSCARMSSSHRLLPLSLQPYVPVQIFRLDGALILQTLSLPVDLLVYFLLFMIGSSMAVYHRARSLELRESRLEADLARAQLDALRLEIEPHFLFNTLNSIASLIRSRASDRALAMLLGLSDLLRAAVDGRRQHTTTLAEETAFVKRYVELQRARFSDRLEVRYSFSPESERCAVPSFLLQPVVENAFRHGLRADRALPLSSWQHPWMAANCTSGFVTMVLACRRTSTSIESRRNRLAQRASATAAPLQRGGAACASNRPRVAARSRTSGFRWTRRGGQQIHR